MKERKKFSSGVIWEDIVGYSRAVKIDDRILVSGTTAIVDGKIVGKDDMYLQTRTIIEKIESVLIQAGSSLEDIIRLRIFVTDISKWEEAGKALGEKFRTIKPAQTLVGISALVDPDMLVEIEAEAITSS
ncbi:MAG TPA: RidA family protein [Ignavibacteria bacterium]|nr:RidA family protein [Ignavibacteria bacterium]HRB00356.1 RidA family protein [Ignavibacteria bacterium]